MASGLVTLCKFILSSHTVSILRRAIFGSNKTARDRVLGAKDFWSFETMIDGLDEPGFRSVHNSIHFLIGGDGQSFKWYEVTVSPFGIDLLTFAFRLEGTPWNGVAVFGSNEPLFVSRKAG
jgi:tyrosinase